MKSKQLTGFTLIEIILMILFISMVIIFITPKVKQLASDSKKTEVIRSLKLIESAIESYYIFSHPNVYPPYSQTVSKSYLLKKKRATRLEKPIYDPLASSPNKEFGYNVSNDGKYYVVYSSGIDGQSSEVTIDNKGKVRGVENEALCVTNGNGCDKYNCCYNRCDTIENLIDCQGCDKGCPITQACVEGICCSVAKGYDTNCYGDCVNTRSDNKNCGDCDNVCPENTQCSNGICTCKFVSCNGECIKTDSDDKNCGECGNVCLANSSCVKEQCVCVNSKLSYCKVNGCVNLLTDNTNCGSCGKNCPNQSSCVKGECLCNKSNEVICNDICINIKDDRLNCGSCGNICIDGECVEGVCVLKAST